MEIQKNKNLIGRFFKALGLGLLKQPIFSLITEPTILIGVAELPHDPIKAAVGFIAFAIANAFIISDGYKELHSRELFQQMNRNGQLNRGRHVEVL